MYVYVSSRISLHLWQRSGHNYTENQIDINSFIVVCLVFFSPIHITGRESSDSDLDIDQCRQELHNYYLNSLCKIPLIPGDMESCVALNDIYTKVTMEMSLPKPCRPIKIPLNSLDDIFTRKTEDGQLYTKLLISAPAGFGKTTSMAKIAYDWSMKPKGSPLSDVSLLFVINMRWVDSSTNLEDAILSQLLPHDTHITAHQLQQSLRKLRNRLVIILDAVDESDRHLLDYPERSGSIVKLLKGKILVSCRLIITTRPWRVPEIISACKTFTRLDLGGFSRAEVKTYIRQFFNAKKELGESLLKYIKQNGVIADVSSVPLMTLLICMCWEKTRAEEIPNRIGELYDAIFNIMHAHLQSKKEATNGENAGTTIDLGLLKQRLGKMALEGLWPPENRLVFSTDEMSDQEVVAEACNMGMLSKHEPRVQTRQLLTRKHPVPNYGKGKLTFFHKSLQEKCAGEYFAHLVDSYPEELKSRLATVTTMQEALSIQLILRFASGHNPRAARKILQRLMDIFRSESQSAIADYYNEDLELDDTLKIQQFLEMCLSCNYEADCRGEFNPLLADLFPMGKVYFLGVSSSTALGLGYYMENSQPCDIKSLKLRPIAHAGDIVEPAGPLYRLTERAKAGVNQLSPIKMQEICQEYFTKYHGSVHEINEQLARQTPATAVSLIQMWQACQDLPTAEETNISPIITSLQHTNIETLNLTGFKIRDNVDQFSKVFKKGHMSHLLELRVSNIGLVDDQMERLAKAIKQMPYLKVIDTSYNNPSGESLHFMAESLIAVTSVRSLAVNDMCATEQVIGTFAENFVEFGSQLQVLCISGNFIDDAVASRLETNLPVAKQLQELWISVDDLSREHHSQLVLTMSQLSRLRDLRIYYSHYPDDLLICASDVMGSLPDLVRLVLDVNVDTPPQVSSSTWNHFKTKLKSVKKLNRLDLDHVALQKKNFMEFVHLCRAKLFWKVV